MFSTSEKQHIAAVVEKTILDLGHPEMPDERPDFKLHIDGKESWSWADIGPNWKHAGSMDGNPWNEVARDILPRPIDRAKLEEYLRKQADASELSGKLVSHNIYDQLLLDLQTGRFDK